MIRIEGHWETVTSLEDVARIIRDYYNRELADKMEELLPDFKFLAADLEELEDLREMVHEIRGIVCV